MIEIGDRVKIVRVNCWSLRDDGLTWAHGMEGTITEINLGLLQPYFVKFDTITYSWKGLWCTDVSHVFERVVLPKELFEI